MDTNERSSSADDQVGGKNNTQPDLDIDDQDAEAPMTAPEEERPDAQRGKV